MTAPMVDYKIHWLKMMSVPESRAVVGRHDGINGRDRRNPTYRAGSRRKLGCERNSCYNNTRGNLCSLGAWISLNRETPVGMKQMSKRLPRGINM